MSSRIMMVSKFIVFVSDRYCVLDTDAWVEDTAGGKITTTKKNM